MRLEDMFRFILSRAKDCELNTHYAFLLGSSSETLELIILSYKEMVHLVEQPNMILSKELKSISKKHKAKNDAQVNRNRKECISFAAVCLFPAKCVLALGSPKDNLLFNEVVKLFEKLNEVFRDSLPDMKTKFIGKKTSVDLYRINETACWFYGECAFQDINKSPDFKERLLETGLRETQLAGAKFIDKQNLETLTENGRCNPLVFVCLASGKCNMFTLDNLLEDIEIRVKYIHEKWHSLFIDETLEQLLKPITTIKSNVGNLTKSNGCGTISIYGDYSQKYVISPQSWNSSIYEIINYPSIDLLKSYNSLVKHWFNLGLSSCIYPEQVCQTIALENRMVKYKDTRNETIKKFNAMMEDGTYALGFERIALKTKAKERTKLDSLMSFSSNAATAGSSSFSRLALVILGVLILIMLIIACFICEAIQLFSFNFESGLK